MQWPEIVDGWRVYWVRGIVDRSVDPTVGSVLISDAALPRSIEQHGLTGASRAAIFITAIKHARWRLLRKSGPRLGCNGYLDVGAL